MSLNVGLLDKRKTMMRLGGCIWYLGTIDGALLI